MGINIELLELRVNVGIMETINGLLQYPLSSNMLKVVDLIIFTEVILMVMVLG